MAILARAGSNDPDFTLLVANVAPNGNRSADSVLAIDNFVRFNFIYRGEENEVLRTVPYMLQDLATRGRMEGDCDDMTIFSSAMLRAAGFLTRMTAIQSETPNDFDHVFSEARVGSDCWIPVDPTVPPGTPYRMFGFMSEVV